MDLLQALAERCLRHLSRSSRFHADDSRIAYRNVGPGDRLRTPRRAARNAGGALSELAHQSQSELGRQNLDRTSASRHGLAQLLAGSTGAQRSVIAKFCPPHARSHSGEQPRALAGRGLEHRRPCPQRRRLWLKSCATRSLSAAATMDWYAPRIWRPPDSKERCSSAALLSAEPR